MNDVLWGWAPDAATRECLKKQVIHREHYRRCVRCLDKHPREELITLLYMSGKSDTICRKCHASYTGRGRVLNENYFND